MLIEMIMLTWDQNCSLAVCSFELFTAVSFFVAAVNAATVPFKADVKVEFPVAVSLAIANLLRTHLSSFQELSQLDQGRILRMDMNR